MTSLLHEYANHTQSRLTDHIRDEDEAQRAYDWAQELTIEYMQACELGPAESGIFPADLLGDGVDDDVQTLLQLAMQRSPRLMSGLRDIMEVYNLQTDLAARPPAVVEPRVPYVPLDGFNITPGVTFRDDDHPDVVWIAQNVARDDIAEVVHVWAHDNGDEMGHVRQRSFVFAYCDKVHMIGMVVNPTDLSDNNWGSR